MLGTSIAVSVISISHNMHVTIATVVVNKLF